jgi:hypothetical protein
MDCHLRSTTVAGYALAVNTLFELRNYPIPANLAKKDNMMSKIRHAREREENIVQHWIPLTKEMYFEMAKRAKASSRDSIDSVLFDVFNLIRVGGFRVAEYTLLEEFVCLPEFVYVSTIVWIWSVRPNWCLGLTLFSYFRFLFVTCKNYGVKRQGNLLTKILLSPQYVSTSVRQYVSTSVRQYVSTSVCQYAIMRYSCSTSVRQYVSTPVRQYISTSVHQYVSTSVCQ